jgi:hypothetical protein
MHLSAETSPYVVKAHMRALTCTRTMCAYIAHAERHTHACANTYELICTCARMQA